MAQRKYRVRFDIDNKKRRVEDIKLNWDKFMYVELICSPVKGIGSFTLRACEILSVQNGVTIMSLTISPVGILILSKEWLPGGVTGDDM